MFERGRPRTSGAWFVAIALLGLITTACTTTRRQVKQKTSSTRPPIKEPPPTSGSQKKPEDRSNTNGKQSPPPSRNQPNAQAKGQPFQHVVLLNGGLSPNLNFYSHLLHLKLMRKTLRSRGMPDQSIDIFSSDGDNNNPDLAKRSGKTSDLLESLFEGRFEWYLLSPQVRLVNTTIPGKTLRSATSYRMFRYFKNLWKELPRRGPLRQRPLLMFVTDHGQPNRSQPRNNFINLWNEKLTVRQFHRMLRPLGSRRVVSVMSQCFSGGFAWSNYRQPGVLSPPTGNRCGFYSTTATRPAYGCYPDTNNQTYVGHAHRFAQAMKHASTMDEAHQWVSLTDKTPDVPIRSSDSYLYAILQREAQQQGYKFEQLVDQILAQHRRSGYPGYPQDNQHLKLLAQRFNLPMPSYLRESNKLKQKLFLQINGWRRLEGSWTAAHNAIRGTLLEEWYKGRSWLRRELVGKFNDLRANPEVGRYLDRDIHLRRLRNNFVSYMQRNPKLLRRIRRLHSYKKQMHQQWFWGQTLLAVYLRMDRQLIRIAGRLFLQHHQNPDWEPHKTGLQRLLQCEATSLGPSPQPKDLTKLQPITNSFKPRYPSWLGVNYQQFKNSRDPRVTAGAVRVSGVYINTPAADAKLQVGDVLIKTNGQPLRTHYDLRERVMLHPLHKPFRVVVLRGRRTLNKLIKLRRTYGTQKLQQQPVIGMQLNNWRQLKTLSMSEPLPNIKKSTTLVFFWATWCGPCKLALPSLRQIKKRYQGQGLHVVTVSPEKPGVILNWLRNHPRAMPFTNTQDPKSDFSIRLRITATPTFLLLHRGKVRMAHRGFYRMDRVHRSIQHHLTKNPD